VTTRARRGNGPITPEASPGFIAFLPVTARAGNAHVRAVQRECRAHVIERAHAKRIGAVTLLAAACGELLPVRVALGVTHGAFAAGGVLVVEACRAEVAGVVAFAALELPELAFVRIRLGVTRRTRALGQHEAPASDADTHMAAGARCRDMRAGQRELARLVVSRDVVTGWRPALLTVAARAALRPRLRHCGRMRIDMTGRTVFGDRTGEGPRRGAGHEAHPQLCAPLRLVTLGAFGSPVRATQRKRGTRMIECA